MKLTNGEIFVVENGLRLAVEELRKSAVKSLGLNTVVARNLKLVSDLCQTFRKEISEFMPDELRKLNEKKDQLSTDEIETKADLTKQYNAEVNKFLEDVSDVDFFKLNISMESLSNVELGYDTSNILQLILLGE
jgi:hypothetical protein